MTIGLDGHSLDISDIVSCAREGEEVRMTDAARQRVNEGRQRLKERIESGDVIYGVNTGFGDLADVQIEPDEITELQENIVTSHAAGVGEPMAEDEVRAMALLRLNSLLHGNSGIRERPLQLLVDVLNEGLYPYVPRKGSVGASGDLAPLAHMARALIGDGKLMDDGEWRDAGDVLQEHGLEPVTLQEKEGLALVNGTNFMTAIGALAVHDAEVLLDTIDVAGTMSAESLRTVTDAFIEEVQELRPHEGQQRSARNIRGLMEGSDLVDPSEHSEKVQDTYTVRCMPQVHGASRDLVTQARETIETEVNAVTDNPLVLEDGRVVSGGNFHGQPIAMALDQLKMAVAELGNISERRVARLVDRDNNEGLPAFLTEHGGLNSGLMIPQYTAAALVTEDRVLSQPSSTDSVPTSANQEDHVSMGANGANHLRTVVENVQTILAIELLTAFQALSLRDDEPGQGTQQAHAIIGDVIDPITGDRYFGDDIRTVQELVKDGALADLVRRGAS